MKTLILALTTCAIVACGGAPKSDAQTASGGGAGTGTTTGGSSAAPAEKSAADMGDLEYGRLKESITKDFGSHLAKFKETCGFDVKYDVDWASFGRKEEIVRAFWSNTGTEKVVGAAVHACSDAAGKAAVKKKISAIRVVNVSGPSKASAVIAGGTLTVQLSWTSSATTMNGSGMNDSELAATILKQL